LKKQLAGLGDLRKALEADDDYRRQEEEILPPEMLGGGYTSKCDWLPGGDTQMRGPH